MKKPRMAFLCAAFAACMAAAYGPFFLHYNVKILLGYIDRWAYFGPMAYYMDAVIHRGEFPLWNPLTFCGAPFAANLQSAVFYPPHLLRSLLTLHPTPLNAFTGLAIMTLAHLFVAAAGTYALGRSHAMSRTAASTAALAYAFGAAMTRRVAEVWLFAAMAAWMPVILWLIHRAFRAPSRRGAVRNTLGAGLVLGTSILAGFPQMTLYMLTAAAAYALLLPWLECGGARNTPRAATILAAAFVLGILIAAPAWVPAAEFARFSPRVKSIGESYTYSGHIVGPLYLLRGLLTFPGVTWPGSCGLRMAGATAFILAFAALLHPRKRTVALFAIVFALLLDCSLGERFLAGRLLAWIAPFKMMVPARASLLASLAFAMLAGFGVDAIAYPRPSAQARWIRLGVLMAIGVPALALLWRWEIPDPFIRIGAIIWYIPMVAFLAMLLCGYRWRSLRYALPFLLFAEILIWMPSYLVFVVDHCAFPADYNMLNTPASAFSRNNARAGDRYRFNDDFLCANMDVFALTPTVGGYDPLYIDTVRHVLSAPGHETEYKRDLSTHEILAANPWGNLFLKRRFWLVPAYAAGALPPKDTPFPPTCAVFLNDAPELPIQRLERADLPRAVVSGHTETSPLALPPPPAFAAAGQAGWREASTTCTLPACAHHRALHLAVETNASGTISIRFNLPDGETTWAEEQSFSGHTLPATLDWPLPDLPDCRATVVFRTQATRADTFIRILEATLIADRADENDRLHIADAGANNIRVTVEGLTENRLLLFTEAAYPGWRACIDGHETPVYRANDAFQAILVPPGTHDVVFRFRSRAVVLGLCVGLLSTLGILGGIAATRPQGNVSLETQSK